MSKKIGGIICIILSVLIYLYFDMFIYKIIGLLGINIDKYTMLVRTLISLGINILMCIMIYLLYRRDYKHSRNKKNIIIELLVLIVGVIGLTLGIYFFGYVVRYLGDIFDVKIINNSFYNIFDKKIDIYLIIKIIKDYIIKPFMLCSIILLGLDKIIRRESTFIILSGITAGVIYALSLSGNILFMIINSLNSILIFIVLSIVYKRNNNIWLSIILYSLYLISYGIILKYIRM